MERMTSPNQLPHPSCAAILAIAEPHPSATYNKHDPLDHGLNTVSAVSAEQRNDVQLWQW